MNPELTNSGREISRIFQLIPKLYKWAFVDAHFVGAKVNNNKRRVSIVYTNEGEVGILDIKDSQLKCVYQQKPAFVGYEVNIQDSVE